MFVIAGAVLGFALGVFTAKKRDGTPADMAQYGAGFGIAFALAGLLFTVVLHRMAV